MKVIAMLAALGVAGCSLIGVRGPPSPLPAHGMVTCSDSYVAPIKDSVVTGLAVLAIAAGTYSTAVAPRDSGDGRGDGQGIVDISAGGFWIFTGLVLGLPYGLSAISGYSDVSRCNDANGPTRQRQLETDAAMVEQAEQLTNAAVLAARAGDCATMRQIALRLKNLDSHLHDTLFHDPAITHCLAAVDGPYCFAETADGKITTACLPTEAECQHAVEMLSLGSGSTCIAEAPAD